MRIQWGLVLGIAMLTSCVESGVTSRTGADSAGIAGASPIVQVGVDAEDVAARAEAALRAGDFEDAEKEARLGLSARGDHPKLRLVRAITQYVKTMHQLTLDGRTLIIGGLEGGFNPKYFTSTMRDAESELGLVEADLAVAAKDHALSMELCVACFRLDWDGNGRIDRRDARLPQIEIDEDGQELPEDDPRRTPTFRFDEGDVAWARAFVSFQRAALDVLLAYDFSQAPNVVRALDHERGTITIKLTDAARIAEARQRILDGLAFSDASRDLYLAETDDDREWVPNPKQKSHPMPLPVDPALYATWAEVVRDVRALVQGEEGLGVADVFKLAEETPGKNGVHGYIDIGEMLSHPKDIVLSLDRLREMDRHGDTDGLLSATFGGYYKASMKASPLPKTLLRMKGEIDKGEHEFDRKLRYLFWIN
ncbi:MAG: hypothetical protein U0441_38340 [Polyangiaceae bacterium]